MQKACWLLVFLAAIAAHAPGCAGADTPPTYAVLSLVGDKLNIVATMRNVPSRDARRDAPLALTGSRFDNTINRAVGDAVQSVVPLANVIELTPRTRYLFSDQHLHFAEKNGLMSVPVEISEALEKNKANYIVLVTKHRAVPGFMLTNFSQRAGTLEGLGFFLDGALRGPNTVFPELGRGNIAAFAFINIYLVDVASFSVLNMQRLKASVSLAPEDSIFDAVLFWEKVPIDQKIKVIDQLLRRETLRVVPQLMGAR